MSEDVWLFILSVVLTGVLAFMSWLAKSINSIEKTLPKEYVLKTDYQNTMTAINHAMDKMLEKQDKILDKLDTKQDKPK